MATNYVQVSKLESVLVVRPSQEHKYGCPYCGANTAVMPTEDGPVWAICEGCLPLREN